MLIRIIPKLELDALRLAAVSERVDAQEHANDTGARMWWRNENMARNYCVACLGTAQTSEPIGILYFAGLPDATGAAWWLDSRFRGKKLGSRMIDAFAEHLKTLGVTKIAPIRIDTYMGKYHEQSSSLERRLRSHFP